MAQHDVCEENMCAHRLCALDLWWLVRVVVVNLEREVERATLVHAYAPGHQDLIIGERETIQTHTFVGADCKGKV